MDRYVRIIWIAIAFWPDTIAESSKRWFRVRETYGVEVPDDEDSALVLAVTVAVDALTRAD